MHVSYRKASTVFKLHGQLTATAGNKRKHPDTELPGSSNKSAYSAVATDAPATWPKEKACFQLLHVNGIPAWANRYMQGMSVHSSVCVAVGLSYETKYVTDSINVLWSWLKHVLISHVHWT